MEQIESILNRPKTYYNIDGVGELAMGFMCLGCGLLMWLQRMRPRTPSGMGCPRSSSISG